MATTLPGPDSEHLLEPVAVEWVIGTVSERRRGGHDDAHRSAILRSGEEGRTCTSLDAIYRDRRATDEGVGGDKVNLAAGNKGLILGQGVSPADIRSVINETATTSLDNVDGITKHPEDGSCSMNDDEVLSSLSGFGLDVGSEARLWGGLTDLLAGFAAIGRGGATTLVKIDGDRDVAWIYTVVVSGGPLGDVVFRKDGADLGGLVREAISVYIEAIHSGQVDETN